MTADVIPIKPEPRWLEGPARCHSCGHRWRAIAPQTDTFLECPSCKDMRGMWSGPIVREGYRWECGCGNQLYHLTPDGAHCPMCGRFPKDWA